jgi:Domain of unknown function (DUF4149)
VSFLRFLMLLSLIVWLGGIIFFATLAPTLFSVLPTRHLAGSVVAPLLSKLHCMGIVSGIVFLASSMIDSRLLTGGSHPFALRHVLVCLMLLLTLISQFGISPKMAALRASMGEIDSVPANDPSRVRFNALHAWSTRLEISVLVLGLIVAGAAARPFS